MTDCRLNLTNVESIKPHGDGRFRYDQTSSDPEVVGDLLVCAFAKEHRDGIAHHIGTIAKSVLNLYLHAQFCMILPYWNHIRTVADRGIQKTQLGG